jgi:hypothetical protein
MLLICLNIGYKNATIIFQTFCMLYKLLQEQLTITQVTNIGLEI